MYFIVCRTEGIPDVSKAGKVSVIKSRRFELEFELMKRYFATFMFPRYGFD